MEKEFFAIGHITKDTEPTPHLGGGVSYTGLAMQRLGIPTHIITKAPEESAYIDELKNNDVTVHILPTRDNTKRDAITTFHNVYDAKGHRAQQVTEVAESITQEDLTAFPDIPSNAIILFAPVIAEIEPHLIAALRKGHEGKIVVTPQGYFRERQKDGTIRRVEWEDIDALSSADIVVLSDEDLSTGGVFNVALLEQIRKLTPLLVMTQGADGATVFEGDKNVHLHTFQLTDEELRQGDFTGAGDTCAAGFIAHYFETGDAQKAIAFGMLFAALKIAKAGEKGMGLAAIPTKEEMEAFEAANPKRMKAFLSNNNLASLQ